MPQAFAGEFSDGSDVGLDCGGGVGAGGGGGWMAKEIATLASQMRQEEMLDGAAGVALSGDVRVLVALCVYVCVCVCVHAACCCICVSCVHSCMFVLISRHFVVSGMCPMYCVIRSAINVSCVLLYVTACIPDMCPM